MRLIHNVVTVTTDDAERKHQQRDEDGDPLSGLGKYTGDFNEGSPFPQSRLDVPYCRETTLLPYNRRGLGVARGCRGD